MATRGEETIVHFPIEVVKKIVGFAIDMGGSVCKVLYRHKDDWEELQKMKTEPQTWKIRLTFFRSEDANEAFQFLKENCHILRTADNPTPLVYCTGIGSNTQAFAMEEMLDIKVTSISEMDCEQWSFVYQSQRFPQNEFLFPPNKDVIRSAHEEVWKQLHALNKEDDLADIPDKPLYNLPRPLETEITFPAVTSRCGSANCVFKVFENGDYEWMDVLWNGSRTFIGLGSLLTGAKTYDELIDLAEKGDQANVKKFPMEQMDDYGEGSAMTLAVQEHANMKREDIALALVHFQAQVVAKLALMPALDAKAPHIFFYGGFSRREFVRDVLTKTLTKQMILLDSLKNGVKVDLGFHFLRHGIYVSGVGALLYPLLPKKTTTTTTTE